MKRDEHQTAMTDHFDLNALRRRKQARRGLYLLAWLFIPGLALALILLGFSTSIDLFLTPKDVASQARVGENFSLGGLVVADSCYQDEGLKVSFKVTDGTAEVDVLYEGILPDLFREGQGVVAKGALLDDGRYKAYELLAKHDETYIPREVIAALKESGEWREPDAIALETKNLSEEALRQRAASMADAKCRPRTAQS